MTADSGEDLFWELVEPMYADPAVTRSTMMGLPCVRLAGRFFASLDRRTGALLVKLPERRVAALVEDGLGESFAPAGRTFREWVATPVAGRRRWPGLLAEAKAHAQAVDAPAAAPGFAGFGPAGLAFLGRLAATNTKAFFDAHRETYRRDLLEPSKALVVALGETLRPYVSPHLRAEPRIGGSLFRIANDLRFRPDQIPYKTHVDLALWEGAAGPRADPALLIRITPTEVHLGCGVATLRAASLARYRDALTRPDDVIALDQAVTRLTGAGASLSQPSRRRPPPGFDARTPAGRYAVRDGFHVMRVEPLPRVVQTGEFVGWCADRLVPFTPVHRWLVDALGAPPG